MGLAAIPDELLLHVFGYLDRCNDFANIALCSRHLHHAVLPILYSSFTDGNALLRTIPFLSTILERPDLARYVKELDFNGQDFTYLIPNNDFNQYIHKIDKYMDRIEATMETALEDPTLFNSSKHRLVRHVDCIAALLLVLLPNLTTLRLPHYPFMVDLGCTIRVLNRTHTRQGTSHMQETNFLTQLRILDIGREYSHAMYRKHLLPLLQFPNLRSVTCYNICLKLEIGRHNIVLDNIGGLSLKISHLSLRYSNIASFALEQLLQSCPGLTHFSYMYTKHTDAMDENAPWNTFHPDLIRRGLVHLEPSLQELVLVNMDDNDEDGQYQNEDVGRLGSLTCFRELRSLEATTRTLLGQEAPPYPDLSMEEKALHFVGDLPEKLEVLTLHSSMGSIYTIMAALFQAVRNNELKVLKKVALVFLKHSNESLEIRMMCVDEGKSVGIVVTLDEAPAHNFLSRAWDI